MSIGQNRPFPQEGPRVSSHTMTRPWQLEKWCNMSTSEMVRFSKLIQGSDLMEEHFAIWSYYKARAEWSLDEAHGEGLNLLSGLTVTLLASNPSPAKNTKHPEARCRTLGALGAVEIP
jgi:hypothetical protein